MLQVEGRNLVDCRLHGLRRHIAVVIAGGAAGMSLDCVDDARVDAKLAADRLEAVPPAMRRRNSFGREAAVAEPVAYAIADRPAGKDACGALPGRGRTGGLPARLRQSRGSRARQAGRAAGRRGNDGS